MSDGVKLSTPVPGVSRNGGGIRIPWSAVWALITLAGGLVTTYVFATKGDLAEHDRVEGQRITVVEQTEKHHDESILELKGDVKAVQNSINAVDINMRTMLLEVGVPERRIAKPKADK